MDYFDVNPALLIEAISTEHLSSCPTKTLGPVQTLHEHHARLRFAWRALASQMRQGRRPEGWPAWALELRAPGQSLYQETLHMKETPGTVGGGGGGGGEYCCVEGNICVWLTFRCMVQGGNTGRPAAHERDQIDDRAPAGRRRCSRGHCHCPSHPHRCSIYSQTHHLSQSTTCLVVCTVLERRPACRACNMQCTSVWQCILWCATLGVLISACVQGCPSQHLHGRSTT